MKINTKVIKIQDVKEGDLIKSYNVNSGEVVFNEVKKTHIKKVDIENQLSFQLANGNSIITSKLTRLYSPKFNQYMNSEDFELGDELLTSDGKTTTKIVEISEFNSNNDFYDFTVKNDENFFVNSILTHNCGVRSGAITVSVDVFHKDIESFIEMKTESGGDVRQKCFNIYPQVIVNQKFIEAVKNDDVFPLLDRTSVIDVLNIDICDLKQFNDNYTKIVELVKNKKLYNCELIKAKDLWKRMLQVYIETGDLYIVCKDAMNKTNPFYDAEMFINSYNLCTESTSPARPSHSYKKTYDAEKGVAVETFTPGRTHTCNLISLNISAMSLSDINKYAKQAVRMLDNAIDVTTVPLIEGELLTQETRIIGVGLMGVADHLAYNKKSYETDQDYIENIFERVAYYTLESSVEIAQEKGAFGLFDKSSFAKGKFLGKTGIELQNQSLTKEFDWVSLLERAKKGVRNSQLFAVAPNTSSSLLCACSASYLPIFSKFSYETLDKMNVPVVPKYLNERFWFYKEYPNIPVQVIINLTTRLHLWLDTGISCELVISPEKDNIKDISDALLNGFSTTLKALYYSRTIDRSSVSCVSCAN